MNSLLGAERSSPSLEVGLHICNQVRELFVAVKALSNNEAIEIVRLGIILSIDLSGA